MTCLRASCTEASCQGQGDQGEGSPIVQSHRPRQHPDKLGERDPISGDGQERDVLEGIWQEDSLPKESPGKRVLNSAMCNVQCPKHCDVNSNMQYELRGRAKECQTVQCELLQSSVVPNVNQLVVKG